MEALVARRYGGEYWLAWREFEADYGAVVDPTRMTFNEVDTLIAWLEGAT